MPAYISEFIYSAEAAAEFVEIALPQGTDPAGYKIEFYDSYGYTWSSFTLGTPVSTSGGHDIYVLDSNTAGWLSASAGGNLKENGAMSLVGPDGKVVQFLSWNHNFVTGQNGAASGMTSTLAGNTGYHQSLQTDNQGTSYYVQTSPNKGVGPACYAPGTLLKTPLGMRPVECLKPGDEVSTAGGQSAIVKWVWSGDQPLERAEPEQYPVKIKAGALGRKRPFSDLIVSPQHRIAVGLPKQLPDLSRFPAFIAAKALVDQPGIRFMRGKRQITWHHLACARHEVITANGAQSESFLPGTEALRGLSRPQIKELARAMGCTPAQLKQIEPALPLLGAGSRRYRQHLAA